MADKMVSQLPVVADPNDADRVVLLDVSDATTTPESGPAGTVKTLSLGGLRPLMAAGLVSIADLSIWLSWKLSLNGGAMTGPLKVRPVAAAGEPVQATVIDPATGRFDAAGVRLGDTGERILASWAGGVQNAANQYTTMSCGLVATADLRIRRHGDRVTMWSAGGGLTLASTAEYLTAQLIPPGFRSIMWWQTIPADDNYGRLRHCRLDGQRPRLVVADPGPIDGFYVEWTTNDPWPSALPGAEGTAPFIVPT